MKIFIDFTQVPLQKVGVGVYALNLVSAIYRLDNKNIYYIIMQDDDESLNFINDPRFKIIKVKAMFFRRFIFRFLLEQAYIPYLAVKYKIDTVHSLHYSFPLFSSARRIVTIHDMTVFEIPERHIFLRICYLKLFICLASLFADKIITDSRSTLDDFVKRFRRARNKAQVIYLGKSALFTHSLDKAEIDRVKGKYKIKQKYFLFLGTIEPRKNVKNIILAFHKFLQDNGEFQLVVVGRKGWHFSEVFTLVEGLGLNGRVKFTGFIEENDKPYLIAGARVFIYPSAYEGFGIPVLEAIACGVPTITSNVSSLSEIAGDAVLFVNPENIEELYLNIKKLVEDTALYGIMKQKSIEQAKKFSWENTASETIRVYSSL